jgi:hypothetical protein
MSGACVNDYGISENVFQRKLHDPRIRRALNLAERLAIQKQTRKMRFSIFPDGGGAVKPARLEIYLSAR